MKPYQSSSDKENCSPISSNCVVWQGPNISCINLCKGDSVSDIVYKLAVELCSIQTTTALTEPNGVSLLQLDCLLQLCSTTTAPELTTAAVLQLIINKICCTYEELTTAINNLATSTGGSTTGNTAGRPGGSSEPILDLPACLQYNDPFTGQLVTTLPLTPYVIHLANAFCALKATVEEHTSQLSDLDGRVTNLEEAPCCYVAPTIIPNCTYGSVIGGRITQIDDVVASLDVEYCNLRYTLGTNTQLLSAAGSQCANLGALNALSQSGTMSSIAGWNNTINTVAQSMQNLWLTVCDMRGVINDLKNCCGQADCSAFFLAYQASADGTRENVTLIFSPGTVIPSGFLNCPLLTSVSITDGDGHTYTENIDLLAIYDSSVGISFPVSDAFLNPLLNYTVTVNGCITKNEVSCSKVVTAIITSPTTTTTAARCFVYNIHIDSTELEGAVGSIIYVQYYLCDSPDFTVTAITSTSPDPICVKPGTIPYLYRFVAGSPSAIPCSSSYTTITATECFAP
jgi:hypothetical protein